MRIDSLFSKISLIFVLALIFLCGVFSLYLKYELQLQSTQAVSYHKKVSLSLIEKKMSPPQIITFLEDLNFEFIPKDEEVVPKAIIIERNKGVETLILDDTYYFAFLSPDFRLLFKDLSKYEKTNLPYFLFFSLLLGLVLLYFWLIKSLQPLKELKQSITKFSQGDLSISCKSQKRDEIAQVANEFDNAVRKIELLLDSRQLFLRTVMHELKTPIAKGRIVSELIDDSKQKNRMINIFEKLEFLIDDFAKIEQVVSQNYEIKKQKLYLSDLIENAKNMLILENLNDKVQFDKSSKTKIAVDYELISMVFKNLIDNAFKYSHDGKIKIEESKNQIMFISLGEKLEKPFEDYFKPFHNTTKSKNHGMGLGLYIVKSILDIHKMNFEYEYLDKKNIFKIIVK